MTQPSIEAWIFYPEQKKAALRNALRSIEVECGSRSWKLNMRPTHLIKPSGRPLGTIKPQDATNLYKRIHRARVGVWQIGYAHAPINPLQKNHIKDYVQLSRFVRHKAFHSNIREDLIREGWRDSSSAFEEWVNSVNCESEGDPRCLPLHVFETEFNILQLDTKVGRRDFAFRHGPQSSRVDENGLYWKRPKGAYHGSEVLHIAGYELIRGFHWDVDAKAKKMRLSSTSEIWEIKQNGYVNVYPDAHIRGKQPSAKQLHPGKNKKARLK